MEMNIGAIEAVGKVRHSSLEALMRGMVQELEAQERKFHESMFEGLKPDGELMTIPTYVQDQFKKWDETFTSPEDRKLVSEVKDKILEIIGNTQDYISERVHENSNKFRLEVAMKAVSKTTSGIQQLLSAQ
jgi:hypothetical protein